MILSEVKKAISSYCPEWIIDSIYYLDEGDFCSAYVVNDEWIFRFAKHEAARASLKREYCLLPKIADQITLQIPLPEIAFLEDAKEPAFIAYPLLPGNSLSQERYFALDRTDRTRCARQIAYFLNQMHSVNIEIAKGCGILTNDYAAQYGDLLKQAQTNLFALLDETERRFIERVIINYLESGSPSGFRPTVLHGDLSPDHIIFDEKNNQVTALIDFGDVMIGDAAWDFLWIYEDYGLDFLSRVLPKYFAADKTTLLRRVFQFSLLQAIDWAISCREDDDNNFAEALNRLKTMRIQEESLLADLLSIEL